jgi:predicted ArsR family transcriptional regulator
MKECGAKCCGKGQRETARRLNRESGTTLRFLEKISKHDVKEGDLTYTLENEDTIIAEHNKCFCQQVAHTKKPFDNLTYCQCSVEFNKQFFTAAFEKEVHVELLQSIICGAESCKFRITI